MKTIRPIKNVKLGFIKLEPIKLNIEPVKLNFENHTPGSSKLKKYISFITSSMLIISESLPFFDDVKGNGIIHVLSGINKEFKDDIVK